MSKRIGIFGGTFDPIHWGHLFIAEFFLAECNLDIVLFVPAYISPLKQDRKIGHIFLTSVEDRINMTKLAIKDNPKFVFEDFEIKREKVSYTIETINHLLDKYHDDELCLLVGEDNAREFHHWSQPDAILDKVDVVVFRRGDIQGDIIQRNQQFWERMIILKAPRIDISSSDIRLRVKLGNSIHYWVPDAVEKYILDKKLYK